jgi:biofilm PGA synthesis N-glycosyltransferase PgaC
MPANRYVLLTAAKNEEEYLGETIQSVVRQTVRPLAWFIVDDGSSDRTPQIVEEFAAKHPFIHLRRARAAGSNARDFGAKDKAINATYRVAQELDFDFIGILDADIAPERTDYYETILNEFAANPRLGIAGGYIYERANGVWECRKGNSPDSVAGGIQMFRRDCFERINGYVPLTCGGEDWLAQLDAKMSGWDVLACPHLHTFHYRPTSSAGGRMRGMFRAGKMDASFGSHPLFELVKCARRITAPPVVLGSLLRLSGYLWWKLSGRKPVISAEKVAFLRKEQWAKLRGLRHRPASSQVSRSQPISA